MTTTTPDAGDSVEAIIQSAARALRADPEDIRGEFWRIAGRNHNTSRAWQLGREITDLHRAVGRPGAEMIVLPRHVAFVLAAAQIAQSDPQVAALIGERMAAQ